MTSQEYNKSKDQLSENKENDYKLNMEILTSIKSLPGKIVNLYPNEIFSKNYGDQRRNNKETYTNDSNFSNRLTSSSYPYKENFPEINERNFIPKPSTENSVFRPVILPINRNNNFSNPMIQINRLLNMNYPNFYFNNVMPFPQSPIYLPNYYPNINQITNITELNLLKDSIEFYQFLQKKRNINTNFQENNVNLQIPEFQIKEPIQPTNNEESFLLKEKKEPKKLFNVIPKSNYVYRKRKPRKKKITYKSDNICCEHEGCEGKFKTKKQAVFHHYKMSFECYNDTINLLKLISETKKLLLKNEEKHNNIFDKYSSLYRDTMKKVSLDEHIDTIVGFNFKDNIS